MATVKCPRKLDISVFYQLTGSLPHEGLGYDGYYEGLLIHLYDTFRNESIKLLGKMVRCRDSKMRVHAQTTFRHFVTLQRNRWILVIFPYTLSPTTCYPNSYNLTFMGFPVARPSSIS